MCVYCLFSFIAVIKYIRDINPNKESCVYFGEFVFIVILGMHKKRVGLCVRCRIKYWYFKSIFELKKDFCE